MEYSTLITKRIRGVDENIGATFESPLKLFSPIVETKTIYLHDWWLVRPQGGKGIAVGGYTFRRGGVETSFCSSSINKRHDNCTLESSDGFVIFISGLVNRPFTLENGFSPEVMDIAQMQDQLPFLSNSKVLMCSPFAEYEQVCNIFINGFPYNWEDFASQSAGEEPTNAGNCSRSSNGVDTFPSGSFQEMSVLQKHDLLLSTHGLREEDAVREAIFSDLLEKLKPILGSSIADDTHDGADKPNERREKHEHKRREDSAPKSSSRMCTRSMTRRENVVDAFVGRKYEHRGSRAKISGT